MLSSRSIKAAIIRSQTIRRALAVQNAIAVLIVAAIALLTTLAGPELARALRVLLAEFTALRLVATVALLAFGALIGSLVSEEPIVRRAAARVEAACATISQTVVGIPAVVSLTVVVALAAAFRVALGAAETAPRVLGDELIYTDLAKGFAFHGEPLLRGDLHLGHSVLYPLFISPAYRFATDGAQAFAAVKVMNSIAMALAAVPAYFLARRVVSHGWSLLVAALVVAVPWTEYAALSLTEPLFYVLFTTFALVFVRMLERPTWGRQLATLLLLGVLVGVRAQALALIVSIVLAIGAAGVVQRSISRTFDTFGLTLLLLGGALAVLVLLATAGVPLPQDAYRGLLDAGYSLPGVAKWAWWNLAIYELGLGVIALAAFPLALAGLLRRDASESERAVGLGAMTLFVGILLSVALLSASPYGLGILHERSLFYVTPLILVCFAHWLTSGRRRGRAFAAVAALAAVALPASLPEHVVLRSSYIDAPTTSSLRQLEEHARGLPVQVWAVALAVAAAAAFLLARRPLFPVLSLGLAFVVTTATNDLRGPLPESQSRALAWVDRALPANATATIVHVAFPLDPKEPCAADARDEQQAFVVWTEFFNKRIERVAHVYGPIGRDGIDSEELQVGNGGRLFDGIRPYAASFVVADSRQPIVGTRLARLDGRSLGEAGIHSASLTLWRVRPPLRLVATQSPLPPQADGRNC